MSPVPLLLCGKSPVLANSFITALQALGSDYEIVHVCHTLAAGKNEIPALLRGNPFVKPEGGLGTNAEKERAVCPKAIIIGKGFSEEEIEDLRKSCGTFVENAAWMVADDAKMTWMRIATIAGTAGIALPSVVAQRVVECCKEHGLAPGEEMEVDGQVWGF